MIEKCFDEVVLFARTGLNPRTNFKLGQGTNKYITIKNIHNNSIVIDDNTDMVDDEAIELIHKRSQIKKGDVLFCSIGRIGDMYIIPEEPNGWDINESVFAFTLNTGIVRQKYFYYIFKHQDTLDYLSHNSSGSTFKSIKMNQLKRMVFKLPSLVEQDKIVAILDGVSSVIDARQQELQKLDELVKARFVELFGDVIQNDRGWEQHNFSDIATSRLGKMLDAKQQTGKYAYPYLANFNVQWFRFEIDNLNKMDFNESDRQEFELRDGDLLVCEGGEIGRCAVWHNEIQPCFFQKALHRVRCNQHIILPDYMSWWFKYNCDHKGFAAIEGAKATIAHLPGAKLKALKVTVPPIELQNQFVAFVKQVDKSKSTVHEALDKAQLLFDSLMQKYFSR